MIVFPFPLRSLRVPTFAAVAVFALDMLTELGVEIAVLYVLIVLLAFAAGSTRDLWNAAAICSLLTVVGLILSPTGGELWKVLTNRALTLFVIWVTAVLCIYIYHLLDATTQRYEAIEMSTANFVQQRKADRRKKQILASLMEVLYIEKKKLDASEKRFRATIESAPLAMIIINLEGRITLVNSETEKMFGYSRDELLKLNIEALLPKRFRLQHPELRAQYFSRPQARRMGEGRDLAGLRKDGIEFPIEIGLSPLETDEGLLVLSAITDITERKRLERANEEQPQKLAQSNVELEQFAFVASHDLQEPLRKVQTFGDWLLHDHVDSLNEEGKDYLQRMISSAQRMQKLIVDILEYSRVSIEPQPFKRVDLNNLCSTVLDDLEFKIHEAGATVHIANDLPVISADASQMYRLFQNLISNALKFRRRDLALVIEIRLRKPAERASHAYHEIVVKDNGIGFEPKFADQIFGIFQRLHSHLEFEGTGIGLAICRKIVERHNGTITAVSNPDGGAMFLLRVPQTMIEDGAETDPREILSPNML